MTAKVQLYHVTALVTRLPSFFLRQCQHLFACFVSLANVADSFAVDSGWKFATAIRASVSPTCLAGGSDSIDSALFDPHAACLNTTVESCCVLNFSLSCAVTAEDRGGDILRDCKEGNWDLTAFRREAVVRLETGFDERTKAFFAIVMLAGSLDKVVDG